MKIPYSPPKFEQKQFNCPYCNAYAMQRWHRLLFYQEDTFDTLEPIYRAVPMFTAQCVNCGERSYWFNGEMVIPTYSSVEPPHDDLPESCRTDYEEAREIVSRSPRGAAALLRLCLQKLMPHLGEKGENLNNDIQSLVKKGLHPDVQKVLDVCRVVGNNAVHPGELNINDDPEIAQSLFTYINYIVENIITRPKQHNATYTTLPLGVRDAIAKRDRTQ